ncbi:hypothetical protein BH23CHL7_BH23CHL7_06450 [soil metagenome]
MDYLPNLFIPGAPRSGTTTLYTLLSGHPDIAMSPQKEPHILCCPDRSLDDYRLLFPDGAQRRYRGEVSTMYMVLPAVIPSGKVGQMSISWSISCDKSATSFRI